MQHEKFCYAALQDVLSKADSLGVRLPFSDDLSVLRNPLELKNYTIPNRLAIQPMEGCDGTEDGSPGELTVRRYHRFARSGAGLIWAEATAIVPEGRANPRQIMITDRNIEKFRQLTHEIREIALKETGINPILIMQLTHSGRYSKPQGTPAPLIARNNPIFEKEHPIDESRIVSDEYLKRLPDCYAHSAKLAYDAGFDGVDIKSCHGYLVNELLASHTRKGEYGGSFENRTRLLIESMLAAKSATKAFITSRMSLYDGFPLPYGWGAGENGEPDMNEPIRLAELLHNQCGIELLDFTIGNPYVNPHVNRPYDNGSYIPPEHPLKGVARMCRCISEVKNCVPQLKVIGSGYTYLRQFSANLAAGMVQESSADMAGFGRMAFAYPEFAKEILQNNRLGGKNCCLTCGKCTELMRAGSKAGCVLRDRDIYLPLYTSKQADYRKDETDE
ncbi:MAG: flavin oxidoreductase/NADH oxidase [Oscillospiraceae bacterium]|nr:flavin oxidoreductase/NADH oxidase [Oscillospiraceae bacterium]